MAKIMNKEVRRVLDLAEENGWTQHGEASGGRGIIIRHPKWPRAVIVPSASTNGLDQKLRNIEGDIRKAGALNQPNSALKNLKFIPRGRPETKPKALVADLTTKQVDKLNHEQHGYPAIAAVKRSPLGVNYAVPPAKPKPKPVVPKPSSPKIAVPKPVILKPTIKVSSAATKTPVNPNRVEISALPFVAKKSMAQHGGMVYNSAATLEVIYSDGTIGYRCADCTFERDHISAIRGHRSVHSKTTPPKAYLDPSIRWTPNPRQEASISRLANEIMAAFEEGIEDPTEMARSIVGKRVRETQTECEQIAPLTPEETLAQIRRLLDGGVAAGLEAQIAKLDSILDDAVAENVALRNSQYETSQRAKRAEESLEAIELKYSNMQAAIELLSEFKEPAVTAA